MFSPQLIVNKPQDLDHVSRQLDQLATEAAGVTDNEVSHLTSLVIDYAKEVTRFAHEYDYKDVHANGFRNVLRLTVKILRHGIHNQDRGQDFQRQFKSLLKSMVTGIGYMKRLREQTKQSGIPVVVGKELFSEIMHDYTSTEFEVHEPIYDAFAGVAFGSTGNLVTKVRNALIILLCSDRSFFLRTLMDRKLGLRTMDQFLRNFNVLIVKLLDIAGGSSYMKVVWKGIAFSTNIVLGFPPAPTEVYVPRQSKLMIRVDENNNPMFSLEKDAADLYWGSEPVRCLYTLKQPQNGTRPDALIVHMHGGVFVSGCPEMHLVYCQRMGMRMPGVGVLQVAYSLSPEARFPVQVQQLLDVYLWLISGHASVREQIGFEPKRIILAGDSAGAMMVTSAVIVLNEIRKHLHPGIQMPISLFCFYGAFSLFPLVTASTFASPFHFLLMPQILMEASRNYRPNLLDPRKALTPKLTASQIRDRLRHPDANPFMQSPQTIREHLSKLEGITDHPFLSPLAYNDFESLSDVELHCTSTHSEPILDATIAILKKWKGPSSLTMMGHLVHGHLNSTGPIQSHNEAVEQIVHKFKSVLRIQEPEHENSLLLYLRIVPLHKVMFLLLAIILVVRFLSTVLF